MGNSEEKQKEHPWELWIKDFLKQWFEGLMEGLNSVDESTRKKILEFTGRKCAKTHALEIFKKAKSESKNLAEIITNLNKGFDQKIYKLIDDKVIEATYPKCYCPLVDLGLINSFMLCNCSFNWLVENFEYIFGKNEIVVTKNKSVLSGDEHCSFIVTLKK